MASSRLRWTTVLAACALHFAGASHAADGRLVVDVTDASGAPVPQVAVYAEPIDAASGASVPGAVSAAVMDQKDRAFVPHILVVRTGTEINFPNSDAVSHHVYSFSPAKAFELPLYRQGMVHPPLLFDTPGVVTLGCNIHDSMVGYILVVDTELHTLTDDRGAAVLAGLPAGRYRVHAWTPRLRPADLPAEMEATVPPSGAATLAMRFTAKLRPPHAAAGASLTWTHY